MQQPVSAEICQLFEKFDGRCSKEDEYLLGFLPAAECFLSLLTLVLPAMSPAVEPVGVGGICLNDTVLSVTADGSSIR